MTRIYDGERFVIGPPGTGKTSFLIAQVHACLDGFAENGWRESPPVSVCSLTRAAAVEIATKKHPITGKGVDLPREQVGTLHSMAYAQIGRPPIAETRVGEWNRLHPAMAISAEVDLDDESTNDDVVCRPGKAPGDRAFSEMILFRSRMVPREIWTASAKEFYAAWSSWMEREGLVDFTGMIEMALNDVPTAPGNPEVILYDEAQDGSALEHALVRKWGRAAGGMIMAGDPWQAIYTWRGANPGMFSDPAIPEDRIRVLEQSYRIPRAVHEVAIRWVRRLSDYREIVYRPRDAEGLVSTVNASWKHPDSAVDLAERKLAEGRSVMIMASCGYMLDPLVSVLRRRALPFSNPWRKTRGDWNPLAQRRGTITMRQRILDLLAADPETNQDASREGPNPMTHGGSPWNVPQIASWGEILAADGTLVRGAKNAFAESRMNATGSPADLLMLLTDDAFSALARAVDIARTSRGNAGAAALIKWMSERIMASKRKTFEYPAEIAKRRGGKALAAPPKLHIGTIHSFKGAEADVVIVFPDLSTEGARAWYSHGKARDSDSVVRAFYVALTRAREEVYVGRAQSCLAVPIGGFA